MEKKQPLLGMIIRWRDKGSARVIAAPNDVRYAFKDKKNTNLRRREWMLDRFRGVYTILIPKICSSLQMRDASTSDLGLKTQDEQLNIINYYILAHRQ